MVNPFAFRPGPVTFWTTVSYLALLIPIVVINERTPPAPPAEAPLPGTNLTRAWLDLSTITRAYHPYNSRYNNVVREFLLGRIHEILDENGVEWITDGSGGSDDSDADVVVFDDMTSNCTFLMASGVVPNPDTPQVAAYFEGTNILVYIRGKADEKGSWWNDDGVRDARHSEKGLTLVNAHYDSVSTGYGATDDGMGVVTCLQLIQHFTHPSRQPDHGIVILLNNGEEDYLYGARALGQHPLLPHIHTFLNLEGAGAGGRAILFRTTDREVTAAYRGVPDPFGTVIASDAFGLGYIRSATDYSVLCDTYGQRGLDLAFFRPRARYHTNQDDARHASLGSLWHMLSAAVHTTAQLSSEKMADRFVGPRPDGGSRVQNGRPSDGVWFDLFGKGFVLLGLRGMFAWSLTVLVATPLILLLVTYLLLRADRYYLFSSKVQVPAAGAGAGAVDHHQPDLLDAEPVSLGGWKGFFRFPFALLVAGSLTLGAAFLLRKVNPFVVYSSRYSVWAMMISLFYFTFWVIMRGADFARPSALHRGYVQIWMFILGWAMLVAVTVAEDRLRIGAGYMFVFMQSAVFLSLFIALCELFALPRKTAWAVRVRDDHGASDFLRGDTHSPSELARPTSRHEASPGTRDSHSAATHNPSTQRNDDDDGGGGGDDDADLEVPTERTPLVGGSNTAGDRPRTTFATTYRRSISALVNGGGGGTRRHSTSYDDDYDDASQPAAYEHEQPWSGRLPSWTWFLQFLLLAPFTVVLVAQTGLMLIDAVHQTGPDGSSLLLPYLIVALAAALLVLPLAPFVHRVTHHVPVLLMVVFAATLVYNLVAFPFDGGSRYKAYFVQRVDVDAGENRVCIAGIEEYVRSVVAALPSAAGERVECGPSERRKGLVGCCYDGASVPPRLVGDDREEGKPDYYAGLVTVNATRLRTGSGAKRAAGAARIEVVANNTKACFVEFGRPVSRLVVHGGSGWDERFGAFPEAGVKMVRLWRRGWGGRWVVDVEWTGEGPQGEKEDDEGDGDGDGNADGMGEEPGLEGAVVCMWSDANVQGTIPALDEALAFAPTWAAITKLAEGLVEGKKRFEV
ncbi:hypothetical protein VTK26DRAFT_6783 [Humicola hyalothermophila]